MTTGPEWKTYRGETHYFIPPHYGRGNKHDGWTTMCGSKLEIAPWINAPAVVGAQRCPGCVQLEKTLREIEEWWNL